MCLDANGQGHHPARVVIWACNGGTNQQWTVNSNGTVTGVSPACAWTDRRGHRERHAADPLGLQRRQQPAVDAN